MNDNRTPSGTRIQDGDVLYRCADGRGTHLYARLPDMGLAEQQFRAAVHKATTNPRCPYTMVWIKGHEEEFTWIKDEGQP